LPLRGVEGFAHGHELQWPPSPLPVGRHVEVGSLLVGTSAGGTSAVVAAAAAAADPAINHAAVAAAVAAAEAEAHAPRSPHDSPQPVLRERRGVGSEAGAVQGLAHGQKAGRGAGPSARAGCQGLRERHIGEHGDEGCLRDHLRTEGRTARRAE